MIAGELFCTRAFIVVGSCSSSGSVVNVTVVGVVIVAVVVCVVVVVIGVVVDTIVGVVAAVVVGCVVRAVGVVPAVASMCALLDVTERVVSSARFRSNEQN